MVTTESVTIKVPVGMSKYLVTMNPETELTRNALDVYKRQEAIASFAPSFTVSAITMLPRNFPSLAT